MLSYQRHPSFTGKNNSDLIISVKHVPAGPCGQTSSVHKWPNNGERNDKTLSSRAIKSWDGSPVLGEGSIRSPECGAQAPCCHWHRKELVRRAMPVIGAANLSPCSVLLLYMDSSKSYMMTNPTFWEAATFTPYPRHQIVHFYCFSFWISQNDSAWQWITGQETWWKSINEHNALEKMASGDNEGPFQIEGTAPLTVEWQLSLHRVSPPVILGHAFVHACILQLEVGDL